MIKFTCPVENSSILRQIEDIECIIPARTPEAEKAIRQRWTDRVKQLAAVRNTGCLVIIRTIADETMEVIRDPSDDDAMLGNKAEESNVQVVGSIPTLEVLYVKESFDYLEGLLSDVQVLTVTPLIMRVYNTQTGQLDADPSPMGDRTTLDPGTIFSVAEVTDREKHSVPGAVNSVLRIKCVLFGYRLLYCKETGKEVASMMARAKRYANGA